MRTKKLEILEEYLIEKYGAIEKGKKYDVDGNVEFKGEQLGKWVIYIRYYINAGKITTGPVYDFFSNYILLEKSIIPIEERAKQLIDFVEKYPLLWHDNTHIAEHLSNYSITIRDEIQELYKMAEENYEVIRQAKNNRRRLSQESYDKLVEAGVGRSFGFSKEAQAEYDLLVSNYNISPSNATYILNNFGSIYEFNKAYIRGIFKGDIASTIGIRLKDELEFVKNFDLSVPALYNPDNVRYEGFIRDVLKLNDTLPLVYNGKEIKSFIDKYILDIIGKYSSMPPEKNAEIISTAYGLNESSNKVTYASIAKERGCSTSNIGDPARKCMNLFREHSDEIKSHVHILDKNAMKLFCGRYFEISGCIIPKKPKELTIEERSYITHDAISAHVLQELEDFYNEFLSSISISANATIHEARENRDFENILNIEREAKALIDRIEESIDSIEFFDNEEIQAYVQKIKARAEYASAFINQKISDIDGKTNKQVYMEFEAKVRSYIEKYLGNNEELKQKAYAELDSRISYITSMNKVKIQEEMDNLVEGCNNIFIGNIDVLDIDIGEDAGFKNRDITATINSLKRKGINNLRELIDFIKENKGKISGYIPGIGKGTEKVIQYIAKKYGISLDYNNDEEHNEKVHLANHKILNKTRADCIDETIQALMECQSKIKVMYLTEPVRTELEEYAEDIGQMLDIKQNEQKTFLMRKIAELDNAFSVNNSLHSVPYFPRAICYQKEGIHTLKDLCNMTEEEASKVEGIGTYTFKKILGIMGSLGLHFKNSDIPEEKDDRYSVENIRFHGITGTEIRELINVSELSEQDKIELLDALENKVNNISGTADLVKNLMELINELNNVETKHKEKITELQDNIDRIEGLLKRRASKDNQVEVNENPDDQDGPEGH